MRMLQKSSFGFQWMRATYGQMISINCELFSMDEF